MEKESPTDEDAMIERLELHRDTIDFVCSVLSEHGVQHERTRGNSPLGDILVISRADIGRVQSILKSLSVEN
jgi:hypothetical protein